MKSLKNQLLLIFSFFVLVSILTAVFTTYYFIKKEKIEAISKKVTDMEMGLLKGIKEQESFYNFGTVDPFYFKTKESKYLSNYKVNYARLESQLKNLQKESLDRESEQTIKQIAINLKEFNDFFQQINLAVQKRGFKNHGIEGEMRVAIHELENIDELDQIKILTLRRHEKDFILRQEEVYLEKHSLVSKELEKSVRENSLLTENRKVEIIHTLREYTRLFDQVVFYERMIGLKQNTGIKSKLNDISESLFEQFEKLKTDINTYKEKSLFKLDLFLYVFWIIFLVIAIAISLEVAKRFTKRLKILSNRINYFVNTNFTGRLNLKMHKGEDEVGKLWNNFIKMEREIVEYIELFKEKVDEKTIELSDKTREIETQKEELEIQKEESDRKNKDLIDGMRYGWRIQRALLPTSKRLIKQVSKSFVFFLPKDIVSGDIYWTHKLRSSEDEESIFSVIDCTGHGVPGAFMSILAVNAINYAVLNKRQYNPEKILKVTNDYVFNTMKYYNNNYDDYQTKDGMDMLLCKLKRKELRLQYSGANRPLYIVRKYENEKSREIGLKEEEYKVSEYTNTIMFEIKPTKKTVGTLSERQSDVFECKEISVKKGDMLYLTSDGYADQFGGERNKKFLISRLKNILSLIHDLDENEQKNIIQQSFTEWKGEEDQVDDITILGVRV